MLKMLPDAFLFQYGEQRGNLVELKFSPNAAFQASRPGSAGFLMPCRATFGLIRNSPDWRASGGA
jgi:hypothetical protein